MRESRASPLHFVRDQRGATAMVFALTMVPVFTAAGVAIDAARAYSAHERLQIAVDAAALAGARPPAASSESREQAARVTFDSNVQSTDLAAATPTITVTDSEVSVAASFELPTSFMRIARVDYVTVSAATRARSQQGDGGAACLLALNPTTGDGLHMQGVNRLTLQGCWAWVNSQSATAVNATGTSAATGKGFCSHGGVSGGDHFTPAPFTGCSPLADPFATVRAPSADTCTANGLELKNGTYTLSPGTYCGGLVLRPQAKTTFEPGVYTIKGGPFEVQGQASASGSGVVFVFKGAGARLIVRGGGNVDLAAPAAGAANVGELAGFLFFQDQLTTTAGVSTVIQGGGSVRMQGILYMPTWRVDVGGNGDINQQTQYWAMVADSFTMEGNGEITLKADAAGAGLPDLLPKVPSGALLLQ